MDHPWSPARLLPEPPTGYGTRQAAVLAPVYEDRDDFRLVLIRRPLHMPTHGGDVAFPGGKPEPGERPLDTALREAREEVGIDPDAVEVLGYLPAIHTVSYPLLVVPVVGRLAGVPSLRPDPNEVDRIHTPTVGSLLDETRWRSKSWRGHQVYMFDLDGDTLWGATARMVRRLIGLEPYW